MADNEYELICPECGEKDFEELGEEGSMCLSCGHELSPQNIAAMKAYNNYSVGVVQTLESLKGKLTKVQVDVGEQNGGCLDIVTNAKYIAEGDRVVVACIGAIVPAGADPEQDTDVTIVKKSSVGGCGSHGILCDATMLAWPRGTKGQLVKLPDTFEIGSKPPTSPPSSS